MARIPTILSQQIGSKYRASENTFSCTPKDDWKDRIEAEIGDIKQPDTFYPQVKIKRWDNEVNFSARLKDEQIAEEIVTTSGSEIIWDKGKREVHFYDIAPNEEHPEGAYEFEVILKEKPTSNKVEFTIQTKGLDFFYQSALTAEEIARGAIRPENVVGSYAVYALEQKINYVGGKEYKCGKVGHIFRPKIIDSAGMEVWGELNVDTEKGLLTVTIPQEFLDTAVYPVRHAAGLTFGYTGSGNTNENVTSNNFYEYCIGSNATLSENGTLSSMSVYVVNDATQYCDNIKHAIYDSSGSLLYQTVASGSINGTGWETLDFASPPSISADNYILATMGAKGSSKYYRIGEDDTATGANSPRITSSYPTFPDPILPPGYTFANSRFSIYATYTAGGGGAVSPATGFMTPRTKFWGM